MRRGLAVVLTVALGVAVLSAGAGAASVAPDDDRLPGRYIVLLDHGDPGEVAEEHHRADGVQVRHAYRRALRG